MSEREYKEWNAISYLRDFINTQLIITPRENAILDFIYNHQNNLPTNILNECHQYRLCRRCQEILPVTMFEGKTIICRECRRKENENRINKRVKHSSKTDEYSNIIGILDEL